MKAKTKNKTGMRFSTSEQPEYAFHYASFKNQSDILTPRDGLSALSSVYDRKGVMLKLYHLLGDAKTGMVKNNDGMKVMAVIPGLQNELNEIEGTFEEYKKDMKNGGFPEPSEMPSSLHTDKMRTLARIDIANMEREALEKRLQEFTDQDEAVENEQMLKFGPLGSGVLTAGTLTSIDGQRVEKVQGELVITSKNSPYYGMRVPDYRQFIMAPYQEQRRNRLNSLHEKRQAELRATGNSSTIVNTSLKSVSRASLPKWPANVTNYLEEKTK